MYLFFFRPPPRNPNANYGYDHFNILGIPIGFKSVSSALAIGRAKLVSSASCLNTLEAKNFNIETNSYSWFGSISELRLEMIYLIYIKIICLALPYCTFLGMNNSILHNSDETCIGIQKYTLEFNLPCYTYILRSCDQ